MEYQSDWAPIWISPAEFAEIWTPSSNTIDESELVFDELTPPNPPTNPPPPTLAMKPEDFRVSPSPIPTILLSEEITTEPFVLTTVPAPSVSDWVGVDSFPAVAPDPPANVA